MRNKFKFITRKLKPIPFYQNTLPTIPVSNVFGFDRGLPIDRYYIEKFLFGNKQFIKGEVLEIAESTYTRKFGGKEVKKSLVFNINTSRSKTDIIGNLATGEGIKENLVDCFILTQTLPFIYNIHNAIENAIRLVKPSGTLLITIPGITQISRYDMDRWGHYWSFTDASLLQLLLEVIPRSKIRIETYGNVKAAACFLYGLAANELSRDDLEFHDPDYQVIISAVVKKSLK